MKYHEGAEEDAARDAFYDQISKELYPDHKDQAIREFTSDRLRSFYIDHPDVMRPALGSMKEAKALHDGGHHSAAVLFFATALELFFKATILQPVVYGLVHHEGLAQIVMEHALGQTGFNRYQALLSTLFVEIAGIDLKSLSRKGATKTLMKECAEIQMLRNGIIHQGKLCDSNDAEYAWTISAAAYDIVVLVMLAHLKLVVHSDGSIRSAP